MSLQLTQLTELFGMLTPENQTEFLKNLKPVTYTLEIVDDADQFHFTVCLRVIGPSITTEFWFEYHHDNTTVETDYLYTYTNAHKEDFVVAKCETYYRLKHSSTNNETICEVPLHIGKSITDDILALAKTHKERYAQ